jgi:hypothetical protein
MTISHPSKVKNILASGIDSLVISMDIDWKDASLFDVLDKLKEKAKEYSHDYPGIMNHFNTEEIWPFTIKPHGTKGFSWILSGSDFTYKIANSLEPGSRPNVMIEIRSEALWRLGPEEVLKIALSLIEVNGGRIIEAKLSRVDLCVDFLMSEKIWSQSLMEYAVTRATDFVPYYTHKKMTGIKIGKDIISARLYDKPLEIQQQSKKYWMYGIWGINETPQGKKIIRIEFQMRREVLKQLGLNNVEDLFKNIDQAWAYCTKNWLKFQDRPGLHHTQRSTLKWYGEIQNGFKGAQGAEPLVREKAVHIDKQRLMQQANGLIVALHAIDQEEKKANRDKLVKIEDCIYSYVDEVTKHYPNPSEIHAKVTRKRSKYHREKLNPESTGGIYKIDKGMNITSCINDFNHKQNATSFGLMEEEKR